MKSLNSHLPYALYREMMTMEMPTCAFCSADKRRPRFSSPSVSRPGEQDADFIFCVWVQVPQLVGLHVHGMHLRPRPRGHSVLDFFPYDRTISNDGIGVQLDDQVCGACSQQLWRRNGCGGFWLKEKRHVNGLAPQPELPVWRKTMQIPWSMKVMDLQIRDAMFAGELQGSQRQWESPVLDGNTAV